MKSLLKAYGSLPLRVRFCVVLVLLIWGFLTLSLVHRWENVEQVVLYVKKQLDLSAIVGMIQIAVLVSVWYRVGANMVMLKLYQKDTNTNFRRVDKVIERIRSDLGQLSDRLSTVEGRQEVLEKIIQSKKV